jgi:hypothetical protein
MQLRRFTVTLELEVCVLVPSLPGSSTKGPTKHLYCSITLGQATEPCRGYDAMHSWGWSIHASGVHACVASMPSCTCTTGLYSAAAAARQQQHNTEQPRGEAGYDFDQTQSCWCAVVCRVWWFAEQAASCGDLASCTCRCNWDCGSRCAVSSLHTVVVSDRRQTHASEALHKTYVKMWGMFSSRQHASCAPCQGTPPTAATDPPCQKCPAGRQCAQTAPA